MFTVVFMIGIISMMEHYVNTLMEGNNENTKRRNAK